MTKKLAMIAPSFIAEFDYPLIILQLKKMGFDKVIELTFGAKMINREYHKKLEQEVLKKEKDKNYSPKLLISSVCPGITEIIEKEFPQFKKNLIKVDSPMVASAKICRKIFPKHKITFISPCEFKAKEARKRASKLVDKVICYNELREKLKKIKISEKEIENIKKKGLLFDKFYNDYTKVYPLSGGLTKTAHIKGIIKKKQAKTIDGINKVRKFLLKPNKKILFLDATFCENGCLGGPCISKDISIFKRKRKLRKYMKRALREDIPETRKGILEKAKGLKFSS